MKQKGTNFFIKLKNAVLNFDEYKTFAEEKVSASIKYLLKLMLIFSVIISMALSYKAVNSLKKVTNVFLKECPEFIFEGDTLVVQGDNKQFITGIDTFIGVIINSETDNLEDITETNNYERVIAFLKDKIILKETNGIENAISYKTLNESYELNNLSKQSIVNFLTSNALINSYAVFILISFVYLFIVYLVQVIIDILLLSLVAFLLSRIIGIRLKYKSLFNLSVYAITLPLILYAVYIIVNLLMGFNIIYFDIAYRAISYIYIVTALLIIKSDLIKQNMELTKIVQVQKQIREEKDKEEPEEEKKDDDKEEKKDNKKEKNKKEKDNNGEEPQGNQA